MQIQLARLQGTVSVVQRGAGRHIQRAWRHHHRLVRADIALSGRQADVRRAGLATSQIHAATCQIGAARRHVLAMRGQRLRCADCQVAGCAQLAIGLHTRADQAACAAVEAIGCQAGIALRRDHARVQDSATGVQGLIASRIQAAGVVQASRGGVQVGAGKHVACGIIQVRHVQGGVARHGLQLTFCIVDIIA
ncbi:hypothetical protein D3C81_615470 [compost metagenome]